MSVGKFTAGERELVKTIVGTLSIKRVPEPEIINEIYSQTHKMISRQALYDIKQLIKRDSYHWYKTMREGQYEYIHEFKERIGEIIDLQKMHHAIIDSPTEPTTVKQTSMAELHRLNITLSNYFDVAPDIIGHTLPAASETKAIQLERTHIV
jgi:hypothetical protein